MLYTPIRDRGSSHYCGPIAMSAITGLPGSAVRDAIRQARDTIGVARGQSGTYLPIRGLYWHEVQAAMLLLGWPMIGYQAFDKGVTFRQFLNDFGNEGPYIVNVTGHYIAVSHGELCDGNANPLPVAIETYLRRSAGGYRRSMVRRSLEFRPLNS